MNFKEFFERLIRGWFPEEPKMTKNMLTKARVSTASYLKFTTSLKIVYALTLGFVATWFLGYLIIYYWKDAWTGSIVSVFLHSLPFLFVINALPLTIFVIVFLTKGGGAYYFRSWNAGKKLQFSGYAIVSGYISVMLPHLLNIHSFISPSNTQDYVQARLNIYSIFVYFGLSLMAIGFGSLFVLYKKSAASKKATDASGEGTEVKKTKTSKKTVVLVFVIAVLTVSLVCLAGAHYNLQRNYDHLSEGFEFFKRDNIRLVNEQWTDNTGTDSKYVNFKVGVLNIGYGKSYNVTVILLVHGADNTLLKREEIFVGDLDVFQYQELEVNIEYSGELSHVSTGYSWD
jgi:hypothetical protein